MHQKYSRQNLERFGLRNKREEQILGDLVQDLITFEKQNLQLLQGDQKRMFLQGVIHQHLLVSNFMAELFRKAEFLFKEKEGDQAMDLAFFLTNNCKVQFRAFMLCPTDDQEQYHFVNQNDFYRDLQLVLQDWGTNLAEHPQRVRQTFSKTVQWLVSFSQSSVVLKVKNNSLERID
jgi:hypothetical protein